MVKYNEKTLIVFLLLLLLNFSQSNSQEMGNPISNLAKNEFSVNLYGEKVWRKMDDTDYSSHRIISKTEFGFYERFKLYGLIGAEKVYMDYPLSRNLTDFKGKFEYVLGMGAQMNLFQIKKTTFFSGAGLLNSFPKGTMMSTETDETVQIDMEFNWREYWFAFGASHETKRFDIYGGFEGRTTKRMEKNSNTEYISGLKPNLFAGVDFRFPHNLIINVNMKIIDQNVVSIGVSQKSIGKLK